MTDTKRSFPKLNSASEQISLRVPHELMDGIDKYWDSLREHVPTTTRSAAINSLILTGLQALGHIDGEESK